MNKIDKFLSKLSQKHRDVVEEYLELVRSGNFSNLNLKKLKGKDNMFRIRKGKWRIIFKWVGNKIEIIDLDNKDDNTYNF